MRLRRRATGASPCLALCAAAPASLTRASWLAMRLRRWYSRAGRVLRVSPWKPSARPGDREDADAPLNQVELRSSALRMDWTQRPETVLLIKKRGLPAATEFCSRVADYVKVTYPGSRVLVESSAKHEHPELEAYYHRAHSDEVDFVIVAGCAMHAMRVLFRIADARLQWRWHHVARVIGVPAVGAAHPVVQHGLVRLPDRVRSEALPQRH